MYFCLTKKQWFAENEGGTSESLLYMNDFLILYHFFLVPHLYGCSFSVEHRRSL